MTRKYSPVMVDGKLARLSVSQLQKFEACERRWWFNYVGGIKEPTGPALLEGIDGHKRLELFQQSKKVEHLSDIDRPAIEHVPPDALPEVPLSRLTLCDIPFQGSMDLVWENNAYDYKFQSKIRKFAEPTVQAWGYLEELRRANDSYASFSFHYLLLNKKKPQCVKQTFTHTAEEIEAKWEAYTPLVERMIVAAQEKDVNKVAYNETNCYSYGQPCPYLGICNRGNDMSFLDKLNAAKKEGAAVELPDVEAEKSLASIRPPELEIDNSDYERPPKATKKTPVLKVNSVAVRHQITVDIKRDGLFSATIGLEMSADAGPDVEATRKLLSEKILEAIKHEAERYKEIKK